MRVVSKDRNCFPFLENPRIIASEETNTLSREPASEPPVQSVVCECGGEECVCVWRGGVCVSVEGRSVCVCGGEECVCVWRG